MACLAGPPGANQEQISTSKAYIEQQAAANRDFMEKLLGAKDFQEAFRVQAEYFQSRSIEGLRGDIVRIFMVREAFLRTTRMQEVPAAQALFTF
jgi:hypothetical protein